MYIIHMVGVDTFQDIQLSLDFILDVTSLILPHLSEKLCHMNKIWYHLIFEIVIDVDVSSAVNKLSLPVMNNPVLFANTYTMITSFVVN